ncbi:DUF6092 family protein [Thermococcus radiotolerans]|uniref:Uncharacterized protein n=1 Tax=Thermococcus radiotolerans TaxID=187880 RepID=A0A2Z2N3R8_9EURY|nr:DUF6092 family protein [Thermococcus radiotolerans]ASJ15020.1 hypothetical protein A3L10_07715 [Thermococcus radiotolerans]
MRSTDGLLSDKHFQLLAFLITSARGCVDEPKLYGPLRLLDAASRLIEIMEDEGKASGEVLRLRGLVEEAIDVLMYDQEEFVRLTDELSRELARIIRDQKT